MEPEPTEVGVDGRGAGDNVEPILAQPRNRDVADDAPGAIKELCVDHAPDGAVDAGVAHSLEQREGTRA